VFLLFLIVIEQFFGIMKVNFTLEDGRLIVQEKVKRMGGDMIILQENMSSLVITFRISEMGMELSNY
jgi:hypothetical protein